MEEENWDDVDWDEEENDTKDDSSGFKRTPYKIYTLDELCKRRDKQIIDISELFSITYDDAECLLRLYRWKPQDLETDWWNDRNDIRQRINSSSRPSKRYNFRPRSNTGAFVQCQTSFCEQVEHDKAFSLSCGHVFCHDCWKGYLTSVINDGMTCMFTTCPGITSDKDHPFGQSCKKMVPTSVFNRFIKDPSRMANYNKWMIDAFVNGQPSIKWCPNPNCENAVEYPISKDSTVCCSCGLQWCFLCSHEQHDPAPCDLVGKWKTQEKDDNATSLWMKSRTKECPNCGVRIEKNRACNHMKCIKCNYHFCWLCKKAWSMHDNSTGGFYRCNMYQEDIKNNNISDEEKAILQGNVILSKYMYYYNKHKESERNYIMYQKKLDEYCNSTLNVYTFIIKAIEKLIEVFKILKWIYCMTYYMKDGPQKKLFEYQQLMLIDHVHKLDAYISNVESSPTKFNNEITLLTHTIDTFIQRILKDIENGDFEYVLLNEADEYTNMWGCTACTTNNEKELLKCKSCGACKLHGEQDCRACTA